LQRLPQLTVQQLQTLIGKDFPQVLDVRRQGEWEAGHIEEAQLWPLDSFPNSLPELDKKKNVAVHCKSGYRSTIASSLLLRAGYQNVSNVIGGFDSWHQAQLPEVQAATR
jgi:hydroxyacylglutathione hydrolase